MPNPVTQSILKNIDDQQLAEFVTTWDALEELVISIFRNQSAPPEAKQAYASLHSQLAHSYTEWQGELEPHWRQSRIKGQAGIEDPFRVVLQISDAEALVANWTVMKHLPAAREAMNHFLLSKAGS